MRKFLLECLLNKDTPEKIYVINQYNMSTIKTSDVIVVFCFDTYLSLIFVFDRNNFYNRQFFFIFLSKKEEDNNKHIIRSFKVSSWAMIESLDTIYFQGIPLLQLVYVQSNYKNY